MSTVLFNLEEDEGFGRLQASMEKLGEDSGQIVDKVLHGEGAKLIRQNIKMILPASGRHWKGKKPAARSVAPTTAFRQENGTLAVTTRTMKNYHYLYFPDDGHTTLRHHGYHGVPREFMLHGAENSAERIIDMCVESITQELEG